MGEIGLNPRRMVVTDKKLYDQASRRLNVSGNVAPGWAMPSMSLCPAESAAVHRVATAGVIVVRYFLQISRFHESSRPLRSRSGRRLCHQRRFAQLPKFDTAPGKWSYNTPHRDSRHGQHSDELRAMRHAKTSMRAATSAPKKPAWTAAEYRDVKVTGNRYQFTAVCTGGEPSGNRWS